MPYTEVAWPKNEPVPKSFDEALRSGWELDGTEEDHDFDRYESSGHEEMSKTVGDIELDIEVPFTAKFNYTTPRNPRARKWVEPPDAPKRLFDVVYYPPKKQIVRVSAVNEDKAADTASDVIVYERKLVVRRPDKKNRIVYESIPGKGVVPITGRKRAAK